MTDQTNSGEKTISPTPNAAAQAHDSSACKATPIPGSDNTWECVQCGLYGPWDGVICLNCGSRAEPKI